MSENTPDGQGDGQGAPGGGQRVIGRRYRLVRELGTGGMGTVWAGRDEILRRDVAVKEVRLPFGLTDEQRAELRARTLREARAAARISSPAAVTVFDVVEEDERPWIVMEMLAPRTLADVLRAEGPLPPRRAAEVGLRVLDALTAAHAAGVLHRDVKPANVLFDAQGRAVLTDFGIASLEGDPTVTMTGMLVGSPGYVSPERARGRPPTAASDLWSLGVLLYTAVEGRPPFDRDSPLATLAAILLDEQPPATHAGALAPALEGLLRKDPQERVTASTARELLQTAAAAPAQPGPAPLPVTESDTAERTQVVPLPAAAEGWRPPPPPPPTRRRRGAALPFVVALVLLGLLAAGAFALMRGPGGPIIGDDEPAGVSTPADDRAADETPAARRTPRPKATPSPTLPPPPPADDETTPAEPDTEESTLPPDGDSDDGANDEDGGTGEAPAEGDNDGGGTGKAPAEGDNGGGGNAPQGLSAYVRDAYDIAVPTGWTVSSEGNRTIFREPGSRRFLLVEEGGQPAGDPVEDWERQEASVSQRLAGYERVRIEPADFGKYDGADWEFTWQPPGGQLHVLDRAVVTSERAYALYWSVPEEEWDESLDLFEAITRSFRPIE